MKLNSFVLIFLIIIISCNNQKTSLSSDSTSNQSVPSNNNKKNMANLINDTVIISTSNYEKIEEALKGCNLSQQELYYANIALQRSKRFDEIDNEVGAYNKYMVNLNKKIIEEFKKKDTTKKFDKDDNSDEANTYWKSMVQKDFAIKYLKNFRKGNSDVHNAMNASINDDGFFSLLIGVGDGTEDPQNPQRTGFSEFKQRLADGTLDGIRIYIAKYTNDANETNNNAKNSHYTLILVGTKNGVDQVDLTTTNSQITIQNYGQPCKPNKPCKPDPADTRHRMDRLGEEADR